MKKIVSILLIFSLVAGSSFLMNGCAVSKNVMDKSGAQLWGENCSRCHNAPGPGEFSHSNWDIIGLHMRVRANLTADETEKIIGFLKGTGN